MSGARLHFTTIAAAAAFFLAACSPAGGDGESAATPADAAAGSAAPDRYDAEAFFTTTSYSLPGGYAWSPDDSKLLVSSDETGIFNAYALAAGDGAAEPLTTSTTDSKFAISWFPNDARLLYSEDQGGHELDHLYVREVDGKKRDLTPGEKCQAGFDGGSADGKSFKVTTKQQPPPTHALYPHP